MRRVGFMLAAAVLLLIVFERPAAAHGGAGGIEATNFEVTLGGVAPTLSGVRVRLIEAGDRLELRNDGPDVVVLGAGGEPYLRVGPDGAFENHTSPTVELNERRVPQPSMPGGGDRNATGSPPPTDPAVPPDWRKLSDAQVVRWRDHRIRWTATPNPPQVEANPDARHVVFPRWEIGLQQGEVRAVVFGQLTWVPGPSPAPWFGLIGGALVGVAALGLLRRWGPPLAAAMVLVLVLDIVHSFSVAFAYPGGLGAHLVKVVTGGFYGILGWVLAAVAIRLLVRGRVDGLYAGVFAGLSMAVFGGLLDLATLSRSVSLNALPVDVVRLCIAVTTGAGLGIAIACLVVIQRTPDARRIVGGPADDGDEGDAPVTDEPLTDDADGLRGLGVGRGSGRTS